MATQTAIITGASSGMGRHLAVIYAGMGYDLGLLARRKEILVELQQEILATHPERKIVIVAADIAQMEETKKAIQMLASQLTHVDLFIANAGVGGATPAWKNNWEDVKNILDINLMGTLASIEVIKEMMVQQRSGHIVGISSLAALRGFPASGAYCASKAGLSTYLESLRLDLRAFGVRVSTIYPGFIDTPMTADKRSPLPFLVPGDVAAYKIVKAISKKKSRYYFPWQMAWLTKFAQFVPGWVFDSLMFSRRRTVFR